MYIDFSSLVGSTFGGIVGVFVGFYLGLIQTKKEQVKERKEIKERIKITLGRELRTIKNNIEGYLKIKQEKEKEDSLFIPNIDLPTDSKESIVYTGNFSLLENNIQRKISHVYIVVNRSKEFLDRAKYLKLNIDEFKFATDRIKKEMELFNEQINYLKGEIEKLEEELPQTD